MSRYLLAGSGSNPSLDDPPARRGSSPITSIQVPRSILFLGGSSSFVEWLTSTRVRFAAGRYDHHTGLHCSRYHYKFDYSRVQWLIQGGRVAGSVDGMGKAPRDLWIWSRVAKGDKGGS